MGWTLLEDTPAPMLRWQVRLTQAAPESGPLPLALIHGPTVQVEGVFGRGSVELSGSNSGRGTVPLDVLRTSELVAVLPVFQLWAHLLDADDLTDLLITVAGRR